MLFFLLLFLLAVHQPSQVHTSSLLPSMGEDFSVSLVFKTFDLLLQIFFANETSGGLTCSLLSEELRLNLGFVLMNVQTQENPLLQVTSLALPPYSLTYLSPLFWFSGHSTGFLSKFQLPTYSCYWCYFWGKTGRNKEEGGGDISWHSGPLGLSSWLPSLPGLPEELPLCCEFQITRLQGPFFQSYGWKDGISLGVSAACGATAIVLRIKAVKEKRKQSGRNSHPPATPASPSSFVSLPGPPTSVYFSESLGYSFCSLSCCFVFFFFLFHFLL